MNMFEEVCNEVDERKDKPGFLGRLLSFVIAVPIIFGLLVFEGFVIMTLWNWFLVAVTGITMTLVAAIAIDFIAAILVYSPKKRSTYEVFWSLWQIIKFNLTMLFLGWFIYLLFV